MIEADHAVNLSAAEVEGMGHDPFGFSVDTSEFRLDFVQYRQERALGPSKPGANLACSVRTVRHGSSSTSFLRATLRSASLAG